MTSARVFLDVEMAWGDDDVYDFLAQYGHVRRLPDHGCHSEWFRLSGRNAYLEAWKVKEWEIWIFRVNGLLGRYFDNRPLDAIQHFLSLEK